MDKDRQMSLKIHTNHLISLNYVCFIAIFSVSIFSHNINNNSKDFHKLQGYFKLM
jgi:hypothetical protein